MQKPINYCLKNYMIFIKEYAILISQHLFNALEYHVYNLKTTPIYAIELFSKIKKTQEIQWQIDIILDLLSRPEEKNCPYYTCKVRQGCLENQLWLMVYKHELIRIDNPKEL